jgi:hypothetical protein
MMMACLKTLGGVFLLNQCRLPVADGLLTRLFNQQPVFYSKSTCARCRTDSRNGF